MFFWASVERLRLIGLRHRTARAGIIQPPDEPGMHHGAAASAMGGAMGGGGESKESRRAGGGHGGGGDSNNNSGSGSGSGSSSGSGSEFHVQMWRCFRDLPAISTVCTGCVPTLMARAILWRCAHVIHRLYGEDEEREEEEEEEGCGEGGEGGSTVDGNRSNGTNGPNGSSKVTRWTVRDISESLSMASAMARMSGETSSQPLPSASLEFFALVQVRVPMVKGTFGRSRLYHGNGSSRLCLLCPYSFHSHSVLAICSTLKYENL